MWVFPIAVLMALELFGHGKVLPQRRRLVPQSIVGKEPNIGALQFGYELGLGFRTFIPSALPYALVLTAVSYGFVASLLGGLGFAAGRMIMISRPADHLTWDDAFNRVSKIAVPAGGVLLLVGTCLLGAS